MPSGDQAESAGTDGRDRLGEVGLVEDVERLRAEHQDHALRGAQPGVFGEPDKSVSNRPGPITTLRPRVPNPKTVPAVVPWLMKTDGFWTYATEVALRLVAGVKPV